MNLPKEAIIEYQQIYEKQFGKKISYEKAALEAQKLISIMKTVYKPIKKSWIKYG